MNRELAVYMRIQASVSAAFSFFIGGMAAALVPGGRTGVSRLPCAVTKENQRKNKTEKEERE
jgi:hypothetical protein